jgi:hypothetical protein
MAESLNVESILRGLTNDLTGSAVVLFPPVTGSDDRLGGSFFSPAVFVPSFQLSTNRLMTPRTLRNH